MQPYKGIYVSMRKKKKKFKNVKEIKDLEKEIKRRLCSLKIGSSCTSGCWCTREYCKETGWLGGKTGFEIANTIAANDYISGNIKDPSKKDGYVREGKELPQLLVTDYI